MEKILPSILNWFGYGYGYGQSYGCSDSFFNIL